MFTVTILGVGASSLEAALNSGSVAELETTELKTGFGMDTLPWPDNTYIEFDDGVVYPIGAFSHKAGSDKVDIYVITSGH